MYNGKEVLINIRFTVAALALSLFSAGIAAGQGAPIIYPAKGQMTKTRQNAVEEESGRAAGTFVKWLIYIYF